jgi:tRNA (guanine37-N1)-methyltransferase
VYFTPQGRVLNQEIVKEYAVLPRVILLCGHYKEMDQRIRDKYVTDEISLGDYIISGGEPAAMIFMDAVARLQDGVLNDIASAQSDSFEDGILDCPYYTRPEEFEGMRVPDVLLSGNHALIKKWRQDKALEITKKRRPDLLHE